MKAKTPVPRDAETPAKGSTRSAVARGRAGSVGSIRTVTELMSYAYALEAEAAERYAEFAEIMAGHNNQEVAELFRKLARIEHKHSEQILEEMGWVSPPKPPSAGYRWQGLEGPESSDVTELHYLMQPWHALQIALQNEKRAEEFFAALARNATVASVREAAARFCKDEAEHVRLIEAWLARTPKPTENWALDPDPPSHID